MEKLRFWNPLETADDVFNSIGITQNNRAGQQRYVQLLRILNPDAGWKDNDREIAEDTLEQKIRKFLGQGHKKVANTAVMINDEIQFQRKNALDLLTATPEDLIKVSKEAAFFILARDHDFVIQPGGRGSHTRDPYASFFRHLILDQFPFPVSDRLKEVHTQIRNVWMNPENRAEILGWYLNVDFTSLTNCDLTEPTLGQRLTHVKEIWEGQHQEQSFQIF